MSSLPITRLVLGQYVTKYPILSPATLFDALEDDTVRGTIDLFKLTELLSALLQDIEGKPVEDMQ